MESQATIVNDQVIDLEMAVWEKDGIINKEHKHNKFLKEKMTNDKKATNLISIPYSFYCFILCCDAYTFNLCELLMSGYVF